MITLDATMQAAQDSLIRAPRIKLLSGTYLPDIPFDGSYFNDVVESEEMPSVAVTSTGRIVGTIIQDGVIVMMMTDTARTEWTEYTTSQGATSACPVELASGDIGIVYTASNSVKLMLFDIETRTFGSHGTIASYAWADGVHVSRGSDDTYRLVFSCTGYAIMYSTSSNFTTWSSPASVSISGLSASRRFGNPCLQESTSGGELLLFFDYVDDLSDDGSELINIYYQVSGDMGGTWDAPEKLTDYSHFGTIGYRPSAAERQDGTVEIAWTEKNNVLHVDGYTDGYQSSGGTWCGAHSLYGTDFHFDGAMNTLYIKSIYSYVGTKALCSVVVVDVEKWEITKCYTKNTVPAFNAIFSDHHVWWHRWIDTGQYVCAGIMDGSTAMVIDTVADTVTHYQFFADINDYGLVKNVDTSFEGFGGFGLNAAYLDAESKRLYLLFINNYLYTHTFYLGYIDITETADPITGKYSWHEIGKSNLLDEYTLRGINSMSLIPELGYIMLAFHSAVASWYGRLLLISINSGGIVEDFYNPDMPEFHHNGILYPCYYDGKIYGGFNYRSDYDMADKRGLMEIDLASRGIRYYVPSYKTADNYGFEQMVPDGNGKIIIGTQSDGVVTFDTQSTVWERFNHTSLPGITPDGIDDLPSIAYDPATGTVFAGSYGMLSGWSGVSAFSIYGAFYQGMYKSGIPSWTFSDTKELTLFRRDKDNAICIDESNGMWSLWTRLDGQEKSAKWDNEAGSKFLSDYLVNGTPVTLNWSVDGRNQLSFTLSHGHLFDPHNQMSLYANAVKNGRLIYAQLGELVDGTEIWQEQGVFVVVDSKLSFKRGEYPIIEVHCEDIATMWDQGTITATEDYDDADPAEVLADLMEQYGGLASSQMDIPSLANSHNIYHQWIDQSLMTCIKTILDHFGYFLYIDMSGNFAPRPINLSGSVSHAYPDTDMLTAYSPDYSYANFVNRVVVTGESHNFLEVLYDEESVGALSGVIGWWGEHETKRVYYSEDMQRTCRHPRLEILQSVDDFWLFKYMGGGSEGITAEDYYETWVEITIEGPDLTSVVIAEIAVVIATGAAAIACNVGCGIFIFTLSVSISILFYTLACFAAYSYNIWARPIGKEKQTIQAQADDTELQQELNGQVIEQKIDDPLCYEVAHCQRVADHELSIVQAQRRRIRFEKLAHLQDEVGDIISIVHPYSGNAKSVFITDLTRTYTKPDANVSESGGVIDSISGWVL
ncbi:sialidase family protein [Immundisolibacter sp.]